jgi:hypothetical protein
MCPSQLTPLIVSSAAPRSVRLSLALTLVRPIVCDELCCVCAPLSITSDSLQPLVSHMTVGAAASSECCSCVVCQSLTVCCSVCLCFRYGSASGFTECYNLLHKHTSHVFNAIHAEHSKDKK